MKIQTHPKVKQSMVQYMRSIREQISSEIKDMSFEEERAYLDKLLANRRKTSVQRELN